MNWEKNRPSLTRLYNVVFALLALISISLVILDYLHLLSLDQFPYSLIDNTILGIFAIDYFARLARAPSKRQFFVRNLFDLLAIIPFNSLFAFFRFGRAFRLIRLTKMFRLTRLVGIISIFQKRAGKFLHKGGLIYYLWLSVALILITAAIYSLTEQSSFSDALWWAVVTATTVGYGDISPHTGLGRLAAVLLMINGIGLIGTLTSSITAYLASEEAATVPSVADEIRKLKQLEQEQIITSAEFQQQKNKLLNQ